MRFEALRQPTAIIPLAMLSFFFSRFARQAGPGLGSLPQCTHSQRRFLAIGFLDIDAARLDVHEP